MVWYGATSKRVWCREGMCREGRKIGCAEKAERLVKTHGFSRDKDNNN